MFLSPPGRSIQSIQVMDGPVLLVQVMNSLLTLIELLD